MEPFRVNLRTKRLDRLSASSKSSDAPARSDAPSKGGLFWGAAGNPGTRKTSISNTHSISGISTQEALDSLSLSGRDPTRKARFISRLFMLLCVFGSAGSLLLHAFNPNDLFLVTSAATSSLCAALGFFIAWRADTRSRKLALKASLSLQETNKELAKALRLRQIVSSELVKEKELAQSYLDMANTFMSAIDVNGEIELINKKGLDILDMTERDALGEDFCKLAIPSRLQNKARELIRKAMKSAINPGRFECPVMRKDGSERLVSFSSAILLGADESPRSFILTGEDITERRLFEQKLHLLRRLIESADEGILALSLRGEILWANPAAERLSGHMAKELRGRILSFLYPAANAAFLAEALRKARELGSWRGETQARNKENFVYSQALSISSVKNAKGETERFAVVFSDITKQKTAEERVTWLAQHDTLTGLPNRASFTQALDDSIDRAKRDHTKIALLFIDLDNFKKVNDTLGHAAGDKLLQEVAERMRHALRKADFISRLGGDEFTVILDAIGTPEEARLIAQKLLDDLSKRYDSVGAAEINVTPSIGVCLYPDDGADGLSLIRRADQAMYAVKREGRASIRFFSNEIHSKDLNHLLLENALRKAIEQKEIRLSYQPKHDLQTGALVGFEALARWKHPERGDLSPAAFIPIAEETGLIVELGLLALREACMQLALWSRRFPKSPPIAVNLAARQLRDKDLPNKIKTILAETGIRPELLSIEITESAMMQDEAAAQRAMAAFKDLGLSIAIDDFGTGYSSLSRLRLLPIDTLKIDQTFVNSIPAEESACAIAKAVISMGRSLSMSVVAEGIETKDQAVWLLENGANQGQGHLFSKALSADLATEWIQRHQHQNLKF